MVDISVITPTYNRAHLLRRLWNSLKGEESSFEWVVVDDGSVDETTAVVSAFGDDRITYVKFDVNRGVCAARNMGVSLAKGRYLVFLDSDDELYPGALADMVETLSARDPSIGVGAFQCIDSTTARPRHCLSGGRVLDEADIVVRQALQADMLFVYRREVFDYFTLDEDLRGCECVFVYGIAKRFKFLVVERPGSRVHAQGDNLSNPESIVARSADIAKGFERVLHNHRDILATDPAAKRLYMKKALYRYAVAGRRADAWRLFCSLVKCGSMSDVLQGGGMLMLGVINAAKPFEKLRLARLIAARKPGSALPSRIPSSHRDG